MAETPTFNDAPASSDALISGIPAAVEYASYLLSLLPDITEDAVNEALGAHVSESRNQLRQDEDYSILAPFYDVVQNEEEPDELVFGLYDLPETHRDKAIALEFGDAMNPPRAFVRRTVFKEADKVGAKISRAIRKDMGEAVVHAD